MVNIINKNILDVNEGIIAHQVNCFGAAGGLAGAIFRKYPAAGEEYKSYVRETSKALKRWNLLGSIFPVLATGDVMIVNLFGQYTFGTSARQTEYGSLYQCLHLLENVQAQHPGPIYIPWKMGCGLAGGDWSIVEDMIRYVFEPSKVVCNICKY